MDPSNIDIEKIAAQFSGNTLLDENSVNDQTYQQIIAFLKTEKLNEFKTLKSAEERVKFIYKHEAHWPLLQSIRKSGVGRGEKDSVLSRQLRDAGNTAFTSQDDDSALKCYNESLLAAPADPWDQQGEDMALALANRSALFFRQHKYEYCLRDTRLALKTGYPKHLKYKVFQRQAKCLAELSRISEAINSYKDATNFINFSKISKEQRQNVLNDIQTSLNELESLNDKSEPKKVIVESPPESLPSFPRNPKFPSLHRGLTVKYDSARGRHVIATEPLKCGTYLASELPIVNYLWSENMLSHCSNCFSLVRTLVPCFTCSLIVFCSDTCRDTAWQSFHQYECKAVEAMNSAYQNIFVAYRAISQRPLKYFLDHRDHFECFDPHRGGGCYDYQYESDSESGDTEPESEDENHELDGPYSCDDYENLFHLIKHSKKTTDADKLGKPSF